MSRAGDQAPFVIPHPVTWGWQGWIVAGALVGVTLAPWAFLFLIIYAVMQTA